MCPRAKRVRASVLGGLFCWGALASASAQEPSPDGRSSRVDYEIQARVDSESQRVTGEMTLIWTNGSEDVVSDLWFHLYWNAFANNLSTHLWEAEGSLRGETIDSGWGWQRVTSIVVAGDERIGTLRYRAPDDGRAEDRSVFSIDLVEPVRPGERLEARLHWEAQIPRVRRRTGYKDEFLFLAQWFPKLGVYEGGRGWNCHQFHANTEFYGDYGTYEVTLDLPAKYEGKVGASGVQVGPPERAGDRVVTRFVAPSRDDQSRRDALGKRPLVHDFAWAADPDFVVEEDIFRYDDWAHRFDSEVNRTAIALGRDASTLSLRDVRVQVLMQPERRGQWRRHFDATCVALFFYGLWFGEYPYEQVTVVDPAWGAGAAGGMEYPTLFTGGTRLFNEPEMMRPEGIIVHEAGHQFWYGLVGNNEFEAAWLDEGFNSYSDSEALHLAYDERRAATWYSGVPVWGRHAAAFPGGGALGDVMTARRWALFGIDLEPLAVSPFVDWWRDQPRLTFVDEFDDPRWSDRQKYLADSETDPIDKWGFHYADRLSYRTNSYSRPAVGLRSLAGVLGYDAFLKGMRHYSEMWRFRHPYPEDFFETFSRGAGVDVGWYFDDVFRGTGTVDWSVTVSQRRMPKEAGFFLVDGRWVEVENDQVTSSETGEDSQGEETSGDDEEPMWIYDVVVRRKGTLRLPVVVQVTLEDGTKQTFEWSREAQFSSKWWRLPLQSGRQKIFSVVIDPERLYYLDGNMSDNQWYDEADTVVPWRWTERIVTQYSHLLHWFSSIGG